MGEVALVDESRVARSENLRAVASLVDVALIVALAFGAYLLVSYLVVAKWHVIPQGLKRIVAIKSFLDDQASSGHHGDVCILGSSVVLEGIDASVIDGMLTDERQSYNLSWTGATPREFLLILPAVAEARPSLVVISADFGSVTTPLPNPIPDDRLTIAGWWHFLPDADHSFFEPLFSEHEWGVLNASRIQDLLTFRSLPPGALDAFLREVSRADLRYEGYTTNYKAPWIRRKTVSQAAMDRGIARQLAAFAGRSGGDLPEMMAIFKQMVRYLQKADCQVLIVLAPVHPEFTALLDNDLRARATEALSEAAEETGAVFVDHSGLLAADEFSDPGHPFEPGRATWSAALGQAILDASSRD
ncbi:MAG: hypothetical protein JXO22_09230 [Phycisphaerae bacterium]|nr:hypothetical protein [Phycisphaerae bacterium]